MAEHWWTAVIDAAGEDSIDPDLVGRLTIDLMAHDAAGRLDRGSYGAAFSVGQAPDAITAAIDAELIFRTATRRVGLPSWPIVRLEVARPHAARPGDTG